MGTCHGRVLLKRWHVQQLRSCSSVDHVVPVDIYLPGCPPRPEMLIDAILKLHDEIQDMKLGSNRRAQMRELEAEALVAQSTSDMKGLLR